MIKKETYFNKTSFEKDSIKMFDHIFINILNILYIFLIHFLVIFNVSLICESVICSANNFLN